MGYKAWRGPAGSLTGLVGYLGASRVTALHAATWVSLLVTEEEITSWNARKTAVPFVSTGDFATDSPGEYAAIAAAYGTTWSTGRWAGPTELSAEGYVAKTTANDVSATARGHAMDMLGVSFKCLMDDRASAGSGDAEATAIMTEIAAYAAIANLDFGDAALYPPGYYGDQPPLFGLCGWAGRLALAYSNCAALVGTNATVEAWFSDLATLAEYDIHDVFSRDLFPQRKSNDYTTDRWDGIGFDGDALTGVWGDEANGTDIDAMVVQQWFNNRRIDKASFVLLAGALLDDATLLAEGERFLREWMGFAINVTTTAHGDYDRATTSLPQLDITYHWSSWRNMLLAIDAAYRKGYTTAKTQTTSIGSTHATWGTAKANKTLEECIAAMASWVDESIVTQVYCPPNAGYEGVAAHRRCPVTPAGAMYYLDGFLVRAAAMFDRSDWRAAARRDGTPEGFRTLYQNDGGVDGARLGLWQRFLDPWVDRAIIYSISGVTPEAEPAAYLTTVLADSPLVVWPLDGDGEDESGNSRDLTTVSGATFETGAGVWANWIEFDGTDDYAEFASPTALNLAGPLTYEAWVWAAALADQESGAQVVGLNDRVGIRRNGSVNDLAFALRNDAGTDIGAGGWGLTFDLPYSQWVHVVAVYNRTAQKQYVYVNGVLEAEGDTTDEDAATNVTAPLTLGCQYDGPTGTTRRRFFAGRLAWVAVYNTALSAARAKAHYDAGLQRA